MKLSTLFINETFQNKEYKSDRDKLQILKIKYNSLNKEKDLIGGKLKRSPNSDNFDKLKNQYQHIIDKLGQTNNDILQITHPTIHNQSQQLSPIDNPQLIPIGNNDTIPNPYYASDAIYKFVGRPWEYYWTPKLKQRYFLYNDLLKRHNVPCFTKIYANIDTGERINFVLIGANDNVLWVVRGYDSGWLGRIIIKGFSKADYWFDKPNMDTNFEQMYY
jgi:hypothetical protein